jgi:hypothetical protein
MVYPNCQVETSVRNSSVYTAEFMIAETIIAEVMTPR